ncbi:MAG: F0F1 ATP synthase subunit gamma [Kiloniellales bacterium]|nr:F0F1 ATP synthase subunit gamma [Kiloniellales bacterium]
MPSLKDLRIRIASVKATQKITSAMKMVAAAKLRRAQEQAEASRPYAQRMARMLGSLAAAQADQVGAPPLLVGSGKNDVHLVVVATADRGLCGGFNSNIVRESRRILNRLREEGKSFKILCVGRKGRDQLRGQYSSAIIETIEDVAKPALGFDKASAISARILEMFEAGEFDVCQIVFAEFKSAMTQVVTTQQLIPFEIPEPDGEGELGETPQGASYDYEPDESEILAALLPQNVAVQIFKVLLENNAGEHGARMTAMDSATRNAGDMINRLTLIYNRTRQAAITRELIEIISAKEAM